MKKINKKMSKEEIVKELGIISHDEFKKHLRKNPEYRKYLREHAVEIKIYDALIRARVEGHLTQRQLAKKIGIAQPSLARFEAGRTNPTLSFLKKITSALGLKLTVQ